MLALAPGGELVQASPAANGRCPSCDEPLIPKCGPIVTWHWAHRADDCDPWSEPESFWHLFWKQFAQNVEVVVEKEGVRHRADIARPDGLVVELQSRYLGAQEIEARESFYGSMIWLYRAQPWVERLHFGRRGFWWKHGAKSMATHRRPIYWDVGSEVWRVRVSVVERFSGGFPIGQRVLGRIVDRLDPWAFCEQFVT